MMKLLYSLIVALILACNPGKKELYEITDSYVKALGTKESYGLKGWHKFQKLTSDSQYQVTPFGRLINVKIMQPVDAEVYTKLMEDLENHYEGDARGNDVYLNNLGTLIIDCRK